MRRVRLVTATVQFQMVADDGVLLTPLSTHPVTVSEADWPPDLGQLLDQVQTQVDALPAEAPPPG